MASSSADSSFLRPFVIGIVGPSGSGKSYLAISLSELFDGFLFCEDQFKAPAPPSYKDRDPSWETPAHVNWDAYLKALQDFIQQSYENSYSKTKSVTQFSLNVRAVVIVEHFLLLHDKRIVKELDALFFLEPFGNDDEGMKLCMDRRVKRKANRSAEEVEHLRKYYKEHVWPCYKKYCQSQAREFCKDHSSNDSHPRTMRIDCRLQEADIVDQVRLHVEGWMGRLA